MIKLSEIKNLTYNDSRWAKRLRRKIDRRLKKASSHGKSIVFIPDPIIGDIDVFIEIINEYKREGYHTEFIEDELKTATLFYGAYLSWNR